VAIALAVGASAAQQPAPSPPQPDQPGRLMSDEQLTRLVRPVRAGRRLTPSRWPNGARVAVALTFTVNNAANNFARGDTTVDLLANGEYGARRGLPRVLDVLDRRQVPATFFIAATAAIVDPAMVQEIVGRKRHEIGTLGWSDENLMQLGEAAQERALLTKAVDYLAKAAGKKPIGARGPSMTLSAHTLGILKSAGFLYDSTMGAMDEPYEIVLDGQPSGLVELPVSRMLDDFAMLTAPRFGPATLPSPSLVFETFRDDFDQAYQEGTLFLLTLHPQIVGMRSRIDYLDRLVMYMQSKPNVWFATAEEVARYVRQQANLAP
jgi:peptidoglycan/xylan/chitin deacetylase (PgdA/CDA1 family)